MHNFINRVTFVSLKFLKTNSTNIISAVILIAAFFLRLYHISKPNLWRDEAFTVNASRESVGSILKIASSDTQPPLHMLIIKFVGVIGGYSEITVRSISLFFGMITLIYIYKIAKFTLKDSASQLIILLFASVSPLLIFYSQEARAYSMMLCFFTIALYYFLKILKDKETKALDWIIFTVVVLLGMYTHNLFVVSTGVFYIGLALKVLINFKSEGAVPSLQNLIKLTHLRAFTSSVIFVTLVYLPWFFSFIKQYSKISNQGFWLKFDPIESVAESFGAMIFGHNFDVNDKSLRIFAESVSSIFFILMIISIGYVIYKSYLSFRSSKSIEVGIVQLLFLSNFVLIWLVSFKTPFFYIRYLMYLFPLFILVIFSTVDIAKDKRFKYFINSTLLACTVIIAVFYVTIAMDYDTKARFGEVVEFTDKSFKQGDLLLVPNAASYHSAFYYNDLKGSENRFKIYNPERNMAFYEGVSTLEDSDFYDGNFDGISRIFLAQLWSSDVEKYFFKYGFEFEETINFQGVNVEVYRRQNF